jgi:hypothetical protein
MKHLTPIERAELKRASEVSNIELLIFVRMFYESKITREIDPRVRRALKRKSNQELSKLMDVFQVDKKIFDREYTAYTAISARIATETRAQLLIANADKCPLTDI